MAIWSAGNIRSSGCRRSPMLVNSGPSTRLTDVVTLSVLRAASRGVILPSLHFSPAQDSRTWRTVGSNSQTVQSDRGTRSRRQDEDLLIPNGGRPQAGSLGR